MNIHNIKHAVEVYHPYASLVLVAVLVVARATGIPGVDKFFTVLYQTTRQDQIHYSRGYEDLYLLTFLLNVITLIRFLYRRVVLEPIARNLNMSAGLTYKFIEAGWFGLYYIVVTTWGFFIFKDESWWFNTRYLWDGYPHPIQFEMKLFNVAALSFWLQSLLSLTFEPPRKDDTAMVFHHLLTVFLIVCSYLSGLARVGAAILMQQNVADIIYYHAKIFKYAKLETLATFSWISFAVVWFITRHVIFGYILYSLWTANQYIPMIWDSELDHYFSPPAFYTYFISLSALQVLMYFWFVMIIKVAYRALTGKSEIEDTTEYTAKELENMKSKQMNAAINKSDKNF